MKRTLLRAGALACALMTSTALTAPAMAQSAPPPLFNQADSNGVDLFTGGYFFSLVEGSIGDGEGALSLVRNWSGDTGWTDNWSGAAYSVPVGGGTELVVEFGSHSDRFTVSGTTYTSVKADGATLTAITSPYTGYLYTARDGTQVSFRSKGTTSSYNVTGPACQRSPSGNCAIPISIRQPNGMTYALDWDLVQRCSSGPPINCVVGQVYSRFRGVTNSANYAFTIDYVTNSAGTDAPPLNWFVRSRAQFTNLDSAPASLPTVTYTAVSSAVTEVTDIGGQIWRLTNGGAGGRLTGIRRPGAQADTITIGYDGNGAVSSLTREGVTTGYTRWISGSGGSMTVTDPLSNQRLYLINLDRARITHVFDEQSNDTSLGYDSNGRPTAVEEPEGNSVQYVYDARGNVTEVRRIAKPGTGLADIVTRASYPESCANPVTCNLPTSVTDARGNVTEFTYDSTHGGVLTATAPAPSGGADRPQTRYTYAQVTAVTGQPVYLPTEVSACASGTAPSCVGTASETRTVTAYDTDNLRVTSVTARNGDNSLSATSAMTYDPLGNMLTVDGPLSGSADTTRLRYDNARRVIGTVGPDPDGGGSLQHRAVRTTYTDGLPTSVETGTVASQSDTDWAAFSALERIERSYDDNARPDVQRLMSGSTTYQLTQISYDALGRTDCVAQRMNPDEFAAASLPDSACTLDTPGSFGPDRITRSLYDDRGQLERTRVALGTADQRDAIVRGYTANGLLSHVVDGENNLTDYVHDGHDRLEYVFLPSATQGALAANANDYERYAYDAAGNVTSLRVRDGRSIGFAYDALNRLLATDRPGSEPDITYAYDNLGRTTSATLGGTQLRAFQYDALGRLGAEVATVGGDYQIFASGYDSAGRRTRIDHGNGLYVDYDYNLAGEVTAIRENGATSGAGVLATYAYDDRGRRTGVTRGNGTSTGYGYDAVSRLSSLTQDLAGTGSDLTLTFAYSPAAQIASTSRSNDAFSYTGHVNYEGADTFNGLNQVLTTGLTQVGHDANGNTDEIGAAAYGYSSDNLLTSAPGAAFGYDSLRRLAQVTAGGVTVQRGYDGQDLVAEYDPAAGPGTGSNAPALRRYVHGPGVDEPLVWYEGPGTSDRRWFHADERGSVIAVSDGSGGLVGARNRYDEFGRPEGTPTGPFGYTGQAWLPQLGMAYYRARIYNPGLGRFMQPDPIGYLAGMNLYAYVDNDPVNFTDPLGLREIMVVGPGGGNSSGGFTGSWTSGLASAGWSTNARMNENPSITKRIEEREQEVDEIPFCDEPGAVEGACAPVVEGSRPQPRLYLAQGPSTPIPRNDNEDRYGMCRLGYRLCVARGRLHAPPGLLHEFIQACRHGQDYCIESVDNYGRQTSFTVTFSDGSKVVFGPGGRSYLVRPPNERPRR